MADYDSIGLVATKYKYIEMVVAPRGLKRKTGVWDVIGRTSGAFLGQIKWYGAWRQYCFFPSVSTVFNRQCMEDLNNFLEIQMKLREDKTS